MKVVSVSEKIIKSR